MDMKKRGDKVWSSWRLACLLLVLGVALGARAEPPSYRLPGRKPDSTEPWGAFLGRAAHFVIGRQYLVQHPTHTVFLDTVELFTIMEEGGLGDPERLPEIVRHLRPDITDTDPRTLVLFEIKPDNEAGRRDAREQAGRYLAALNAVVNPSTRLSGGTGFDGSLFVEFENGGALWRLSWRTPEPGVILYRWNYRREKPNASWKERVSQKEEALPQEEIEKKGELLERVLRSVYEVGRLPSDFHGQVYRPVDCR